ncbi:TonB-dependent receptor [uncultured Porphyromonas sp.]|uniref:TonB-dependent receptor domain-containing protein n=1 Tax=uncultured Porphyromonas sp. TaxID=159274 RepID=UPI0026162743|nr:TonB-dependent receptor [uncultured Porphyromonas sp.]
MRRLLLLIPLLLAGFIATSAQELRGIVHDEAGLPLPYATIKVKSIDGGNVITGGVTREDGSFSLQIANQKLPLLLEASLIGFAPKEIKCESFTSYKIALKESVLQLEEVSVTANRIMHRMVAGGISTSIEASPLANLSDVYSVLRGVPLVEIEGTEVRVAGKGTPIIYINDRLMTDPNQLRNLKPYLIRDIEVLTNPGARYSSSTESVIKIYTKREQGSGLSSEAKVGLFNQLGSPIGYQPYLHFNYRLDNWDFFLSAMYQDNQTNHSFPSLRTHGKTDKSEWINQSTTKHIEGEQTQEYTIGINYEDELQSMGFRYRIASTREDSWMYSDLTSHHIVPLPEAEERFITKSQTFKPWNLSHRPNLYYLRKLGEWKAQIDVDYYQTGMSHSTETIHEGEGAGNEYNLPIKINEHGAKYQSAGARLDFSGPLWGGRLEIGGEYTRVHNKFYNHLEKSLNLTNLDTEQREQLLALYLEYQREIASEWSLTAGLRMEHLQNKYIDKGIVDPNKSHTTTNLFPTLALTGRLLGVRTELSFRSRIHRPSYIQLQPQYLVVSRYEYKVGDPNLKDAIDYSTSLTLNKSWFTTILSHTYSRDCLTPETGLFIDPNTGETSPYITLFKTVNAPPHHALTAAMVASPTIKWWKPTFTLRLSKMIGYDLWHFEERITKRRATLALSVANQFTLPKEISLVFNIGYTPFGNEDNMEFTAPILTSYAEISKQWLKEKNLLTTLSVSNLFNTTHSVRTATRHSVMESTEYVPPRIAFTISYRFNSSKDKYRGTGALESVIDRM